MYHPKVERNKELVALRLENPELWSFRKLAKKYRKTKRAMWEVFHRYYLVYGTPKQIKAYLTWLNK